MFQKHPALLNQAKMHAAYRYNLAQEYFNGNMQALDNMIAEFEISRDTAQLKSRSQFNKRRRFAGQMIGKPQEIS
jgi:hypothetical protein